ncbi:MAG: hypothetical protein O3A10_03750 [Chloroflexi bacterium]|nr:hypothetical protein [Chloroflexota bacterium]MDA1145850.1 hypothetical protein [Chloroflexota bacterium]
MAADDSRPCLYIFDLAARDSRLVWFFGETKVPRGLVEASSGVVPYCEAGFSAQAGDRDYDLAVTFVFLEGQGEAREEMVWWLFYPA